MPARNPEIHGMPCLLISATRRRGRELYAAFDAAGIARAARDASKDIGADLRVGIALHHEK